VLKDNETRLRFFVAAVVFLQSIAF